MSLDQLDNIFGDGGTSSTSTSSNPEDYKRKKYNKTQKQKLQEDRLSSLDNIFANSEEVSRTAKEPAAPPAPTVTPKRTFWQSIGDFFTGKEKQAKGGSMIFDTNAGKDTAAQSAAMNAGRGPVTAEFAKTTPEGKAAVDKIDEVLKKPAGNYNLADNAAADMTMYGFANSFLPTKILIAGGNKLTDLMGLPPSATQVRYDALKEERPIEGAIGGLIGDLMNFNILGALGVGLKGEAAVKNTLGASRYLLPNAVQRGLVRGGGLAAIFGSAAMLDEAVNQVQSGDYNISGIATRGLSSAAMGETLGAGTAALNTAGRVAGAVGGTAAFSAVEHLLADPKHTITGEDAIAIGQSAIVNGLFEAFAGKYPGYKAEAQRAAEFSREITISKMVSNGQTRAKAEVLYDLMAKLDGVKYGIPATFMKDEMPYVQILDKIPETFMTAERPVQYKYIASVLKQMDAGVKLDTAMVEANKVTGLTPAVRANVPTTEQGAVDPNNERPNPYEKTPSAEVRDKLAATIKQNVDNPAQAPELAQEIADLSEAKVNYESANRESVVHDNLGDENPQVKLGVVGYSDGKYAFDASATIGGTSVALPFDEVYKDKNAAIEAGVTKLKEWLSSEDTSQLSPQEQQWFKDVVAKLDVAGQDAPVVVPVAQRFAGLPEYSGKAYRVDTGFTHTTGTTAADVVKYEQEVLGNKLGVSPELLDTLDNYPAKRIVWVTANEADAQRYATDGEDVPAGTVDEVNIPAGSVVIAEDGDGGKLILLKAKTQKQKVAEAVKDKEKTAKEVAAETGILEPNVRRILGMGEKEGVFERVDKGVYKLSVNGKDIVAVHSGDAIETFPRLVSEGLRYDLLVLDEPYKTAAVTGGNRGIKYDYVTTDQFKTIAVAASEGARDEDTPVIKMFSQAKSGMKEMAVYNQTLLDQGFKIVARGFYNKTFKDGSPVTNVRGEPAAGEGILLLSKSGKVKKPVEDIDLQFTFVRPKGYQTEKPAELMKQLIEMTTVEGDMVVDPFAGSGVTGAEAVKAGRKAVMIEKNQKAIDEHIKPKLREAIPAAKKQEYAGVHEAPTRSDDETSAPAYALDKIYPADIYSPNASRLYSSGQPFDAETIGILQALKGRPNARVKIYRAVPGTKTNAEMIAKYESQQKRILKNGKIPDAELAQKYNLKDSSAYYEFIDNEIQRLRGATEPKVEKYAINEGDWVTPNRKYAVEHGNSNLGGNYKILSKVVYADELYTDANSIQEFGYSPRPAKEPTVKPHTGSQKTAAAFEQSGGQETIATKNGVNFDLGDWGRNHQERKVGEGKADRFSEDELPDTIANITESFRATNIKESYRYDNIVWKSVMPDGQTRFIITRKNAAGHEEIIGWHNWNETKNPNYLKTLESFGRPDRNRTGIAAVEQRKVSPLPHGAKKTVTDNASKVKPTLSATKDGLVLKVVEPKGVEMTDEKLRELIKSMKDTSPSGVAADPAKHQDTRLALEKVFDIQGSAKIFMKLPDEMYAQISPETIAALRKTYGVVSPDRFPALASEVVDGAPNLPKNVFDYTHEKYESDVPKILNGRFDIEKTAKEWRLIGENGVFSVLKIQREIAKPPAKPLFPRSALRTLYENDKEFAKNPVLRVAEEPVKGKEGQTAKVLRFSGEKTNFAIRASALGLIEDNLKVGDIIRLDPASLKTKGEEIRVMKFEGGAEAGVYASRTTTKTSALLAERRAQLQAQGKDVPDFSLSQAVKDVLKEFNIPVRERDLSKKYAGLYKPRSGNVRVQQLYDVTVATHEATHAIDHNNGITEKIIGTTTHAAKFRGLLTDIYEEYYPGGNRDHKLEKRIREGLATFVEWYFNDPAVITRKYPALVAAFINPQGQYYTKDITKLLEMMNNVVDTYAQLSPEARIGARIRTGKEVVKNQTGFTVSQRFVFEVFNNLEPLMRYAKIAGVRGTWDDPTVQAFMLMKKNSIVAQWWRGDTTPILKPDGNWDFPGNSAKDYMKLLKGQEKEFSSFLVARRVVADNNKLVELKNQLEQQKPIVDEILARQKDAEDTGEAIDEGTADVDKQILNEYQVLKDSVVKLQQRLAKDDFSIEDSLAVVDKYGKRFSQAVKQYDEINRRLLIFARNTGLISAEAAQNMMSEPGYASFRRYIDDELDAAVGTRTSTKSKVTSFKERTGSELDIIDPVFNQLQAINEVIGKGMENVLWQKVAKLGRDNQDIAARFEKIEAMPAVDKNGRLSFPQEKDPNLIRVWNQGKREFYKAAPEFVAVMKVMSGKERDVFANLLRIPASIFTRLTTSANPVFAAGNLTVDQFTAVAQTKFGYKPGIDPVKSLAKWVMKDPTLHAYFGLGGKRQTLAAFHDLSPADVTKKLAGDQSAGERAVEIIDSGLGVLELPSNMSEVASRFSEYKRAIDKGRSMSEAMYAAEEVTVPFALHGRLGGGIGLELVKSVPYFNAGLQVLYKTARTANEQPVRLATVMAGVITAGIGITIAVMKHASDEQKRQLANTPISELARAILIPLPSGHGFIRIRIPQEYGAPMAMAQLYVIGHYGGNKAKFDDYLEAATEFLPDQLNISNPKKMATSWLPQIIKPSVEVAANFKTYPDVMPIVPFYTGQKPLDEQYTAYTSKVAKLLGGVFGMSPMKVDFWLKEQFGAVGAFTTSGKVPSNPVYRNEEQFVMSGRAYNKFYDDRTMIDQQYKKYKDKKLNLTYNEGYDLKQRHSLYADASDVFSLMRDLDKAKVKLPENIRQSAYDILLNIDSADVYETRRQVSDLNYKVGQLFSDNGIRKPKK